MKGIRDSIKKLASDAGEFVSGDHDSPSLAERANQINLKLHSKINGFEYEDVQEWGLDRA